MVQELPNTIGAVSVAVDSTAVCSEEACCICFESPLREPTRTKCNHWFCWSVTHICTVKEKKGLRLCALSEEEPTQSTGLPCLWSHAHTQRSSCGNGDSGFVQDEHDMLCCMAAACLMLLCSEAHATVPAMCCSCLSEVLCLAMFASANACIFLRALQ